MPTDPHNTLSSYLVRPSPLERRYHHGRSLLDFLRQLSLVNPKIFSRTLVALLIWSGFFASIHYISTPKNLSTQSSLFIGQASVAKPAPLKASGVVSLASAVPAQELPTGPSGQLLPPGTMAPDRSYPNSYARGQCTWYVAGRRQIPTNWGNAVSWYYHAVSSGWSVGTVPAMAAVAWTPAGYYGHVALVEQVSADGAQVYVSEMNYRGLGVKSYRWAPASSFKYIY